MSYTVYRITDGNMIYIGSTTQAISRRKAGYHVSFIDTNINWKLHQHWRSVGWEKMRFEVITDDIIDKESMKICEEENIRMVPSQNILNTIKAFCPDHEASRSINSGVGEPEKIANKRKNRRDYYARKKFDEDWMNKQREHNKQRMRERREDPEIKKRKKNAVKSIIKECHGMSHSNKKRKKRIINTEKM